MDESRESKSLVPVGKSDEREFVQFQVSEQTGTQCVAVDVIVASRVLCLVSFVVCRLSLSSDNVTNRPPTTSTLASPRCRMRLCPVGTLRLFGVRRTVVVEMMREGISVRTISVESFI